MNIHITLTPRATKWPNCLYFIHSLLILLRSGYILSEVRICGYWSLQLAKVYKRYFSSEWVVGIGVFSCGHLCQWLDD